MHHLLHKRIQVDTHDSIEDASTALELVTKYDELKRRGELDATLEQLYETGAREGFKVL